MEKGCVLISSKSAALGRGDDYRFYSSTHTISTKIGKITKIEFVKGDKPINNLKYNGKDGAFTADTKYDLCWVGSAKEVVFTNSSQARATNIIVTVEVPKAKNYTLDETKTDNIIETYENANVTLQRTLEASHWNSFCVPFALDKDQVTQYFGEGTQLRTYEAQMREQHCVLCNCRQHRGWQAVHHEAWQRRCEEPDIRGSKHGGYRPRH